MGRVRNDTGGRGGRSGRGRRGGRSGKVAAARMLKGRPQPALRGKLARQLGLTDAEDSDDGGVNVIGGQSVDVSGNDGAGMPAPDGPGKTPVF